MKKTKRRAFIQSAAVGLGASTLGYPFLASASASSHSDLQEETVHISSDVRLKAMTMERIDTHSHFYHKIYPLNDVVRGMDDFTQSPDMGTSRHLAIGSRKLYGIDAGLFLRPDSSEEIFEKAAALRAKGSDAALEAALDAGNISTQLLFSYLPNPQSNKEAELSQRVQLLNYIDSAVVGDEGRAFTPDGQDMEFNYFDAISGHFGELRTLADYLNALDSTIDVWRSHRVVGMKVALAYTIGLNFSDPSLNEAQAAFIKKRNMTPEDVTIVQHYAFRHTLLACQRNELPVVIHTGFQIWGHADLRQSNPILLHNLIID